MKLQCRNLESLVVSKIVKLEAATAEERRRTTLISSLLLLPIIDVLVMENVDLERICDKRRNLWPSMKKPSRHWWSKEHQYCGNKETWSTEMAEERRLKVWFKLWRYAFDNDKTSSFHLWNYGKHSELRHRWNRGKGFRLVTAATK